ncbi:CCA tRNA nucleotidyltransferase [bacterium]|nr:CCA tRNA nucleotidyltransferase [bacterium]
MQTLKDEKLYYIGGVVRDSILGHKSFDIDITYQGNAIEYCKSLEEKGVGEIIKINEPFGTVRMIIDGEEIDIASTRNEIYEKKGHLPTVTEIGCSLKSDVMRRDFTINALAKSTLTDEIIDYVGGLEDINNKILKVLHENSFIDDPTRIIRGLKFSVRFGFKLEEKTEKLQKDYLNNINYDMSYKRVKKELIETFNLNSQKAYDEFFNQKIYKLISEKEIIPPKYNIEKLVNEHMPKHVWLVYLGWMNLEKLPFTKEEQKIINDYKLLIESNILEDDYSIYKAFSGKELEAVLLYIITQQNNKGIRYLEIKDIYININGNDLKSMGVAPSNRYSECFDYVLKYKLNNINMTKDDEINLAKKFFNL